MEREGMGGIETWEAVEGKKGKMGGDMASHDLKKKGHTSNIYSLFDGKYQRRCLDPWQNFSPCHIEYLDTCMEY